MYILVRENIETSSISAQSSHCVSQYALEYYNKFKHWNNRTIVVLKCKNINDINKVIYKLEENNIEYSKFIEPTENNTITSVCSYGDRTVYKIFRKFNLS